MSPPPNSNTKQHDVAWHVRLLLVRRAAVAALVLATLVAIHAAASHYYDIQLLAQREESLRAYLQAHPLRSFLFCLCGYALVSFVPGTTGKSLVVGWLFGFWKGLLIVNVALTMAATASLLVGRCFLQDAISRRWSRFVTAASRAIERNGGFYVVLLRVIHAPFTIVNYSFGATKIRTRTFWWATQIGLLPGNIVFVYAGTQLPSLHDLNREGLATLFSFELIFAFVALTIVPLAVHWAVCRFWPSEEHEAEVAVKQLE